MSEKQHQECPSSPQQTPPTSTTNNPYAYPAQSQQPGQPGQPAVNPNYLLQSQPMGFTQFPMTMTDPNACRQCGGKNVIEKLPVHILYMIICSSIQLFGLFFLCCLVSLREKRCTTCSYAEQKQFGWFYVTFACMTICGIIFWIIFAVIMAFYVFTNELIKNYMPN